MSFTAGNNYGEFKHKLTVSEMPSHNHLITQKWYYGSKGSNAPVLLDNSSTGVNVAEFNTGNAGNNIAHNNVQPSLCVFLWKRSA